MNNMTTEEMVSAWNVILDTTFDNDMSAVAALVRHGNKMADTIERQAEAIRVLREALTSIDNNKERNSTYWCECVAHNALAQTKEFGE